MGNFSFILMFFVFFYNIIKAVSIRSPLNIIFPCKEESVCKTNDNLSPTAPHLLMNAAEVLQDVVHAAFLQRLA